jgi:hypothetical protein
MAPCQQGSMKLTPHQAARWQLCSKAARNLLHSKLQDGNFVARHQEIYCIASCKMEI